MKHTLGTIAGLAGTAVVIFTVLFNGFYMLFIPRRWFKLPDWLAGRGAIRERDYKTEGDLLEIRLLGAIFLSVIGYMLFGVFRGP